MAKKLLVFFLAMLCAVSLLTGCVVTDNQGSTEPEETETTESRDNRAQYVLNTNSKKFHYPSCGSGKRISDKNQGTYYGTREELIQMGYSPCGNCDP